MYNHAYVNSILAKRKAAQAGFDEALFTDDAGFVCEATGENVFIVIDGKVIAVEHRDALPGITRDTVMQITGAEARPVSVKELLAADEVFLTGTSAEVVVVRGIDDRVYSSPKIGPEIQATYHNIVHGRDVSKRHWITLA